MKHSNNQSNLLIKWVVMAGDFVLLNAIIIVLSQNSWRIENWPEKSLEIFILVNNIALMLSQLRFSTIIHLRLVGAGDVIRRIMGLTITQSVLAYVLLKVFDYYLPIGVLIFVIGTVFFFALLIKRLFERWFIRLYREAGRNTRNVTLVGSDKELAEVYWKLREDPTLGYRVQGYYGDEAVKDYVYETMRLRNAQGQHLKYTEEITRLGSLEEFMDGISHPDDLTIGDELYLCTSRKNRDIIKKTSRLCDHKVVRFFFVPVSVESIGLNLKREMLDDMEIFTTYENPLQNSVNRAIKRIFDILFSLTFKIINA